MAKTRMARKAQEAKLKGARGLIQHARKFRISGNKNYIEIALADELEKLLDERDAMHREYFLLWNDSIWLGPLIDEESVDQILEEKVAQGHKLHKASRLVGEIK